MGQMKILYIIESLTHGGKERRLVSLIKELVKKDHFEIELIILSKDVHYKEVYDLDLEIHFLKRNIKKDIGIFSKFNKIIKKNRPDIVHCWDNIAAFHFGPICKFKGIPFINSMISTAPPILSPYSKRFIYNAVSYPFSDVILTNSKAGLKSFRVPENKGRHIYNGFDFDRVKVRQTEESIRNKFNISSRYVVGMTGAFYDRKDYETFIKAGELILKNRKDVTFVAIGGGPNLERFKNSVHEDYKSNFRFVGKQTDVESIVNIFTIGVLTTYTEGISNAIMEYMIFEKPVIATDGGGTCELVVTNENGFLVEQKNAKQVAEKIHFLLENPEIVTKMGKKGKMRIEENFTIDKMIDAFSKLYNEFSNITT